MNKLKIKANPPKVLTVINQTDWNEEEMKSNENDED